MEVKPPLLFFIEKTKYQKKIWIHKVLYYLINVLRLGSPTRYANINNKMIFNLIATSRYDAWYTKSKSQSQAMKVYSFLNYVAILRNFFQFRKRKLLII